MSPGQVRSIGYADGSWHHFGCIRNATTDSLQLYVDGHFLAEESDATSSTLNGAMRPLFIGANNHKDHGVQLPLGGTIDEFIIHNVAKSADYIYNRANPGIPKLRFLASTNTEPEPDGSYAIRDYDLAWGDADATLMAPFVSDPEGGEPCYGLLNGCMGYAGWWRFNEGGGDVAVDSSSLKHNGTIEKYLSGGHRS